MVDLHFDGADMYLGPENTCVFSAKLAASLNKPIIGYVSTGVLGVQFPSELFFIQIYSICDRWTLSQVYQTWLGWGVKTFGALYNSIFNSKTIIKQSLCIWYDVRIPSFHLISHILSHSLIV